MRHHTGTESADIKQLQSKVRHGPTESLHPHSPGWSNRPFPLCMLVRCSTYNQQDFTPDVTHPLMHKYSAGRFHITSSITEVSKSESELLTKRALIFNIKTRVSELKATGCISRWCTKMANSTVHPEPAFVSRWATNHFYILQKIQHHGVKRLSGQSTRCTSLVTRIWLLGPTWWEKRTNSKLSWRPQASCGM